MTMCARPIWDCSYVERRHEVQLGVAVALICGMRPHWIGRIIWNRKARKTRKRLRCFRGQLMGNRVLPVCFCVFSVVCGSNLFLLLEGPDNSLTPAVRRP